MNVPFATLTRLQATPDGGVIAVDYRADNGGAVRRFNADGAFLNNIGRSGAGPGEFPGNYPVIVAVNKNGTVTLSDMSARVNQFGLDGTLISAFRYKRVRGRAGTVYVGPDSSAFVDAYHDPEEPNAIYLRLDGAGKVVGAILEDGFWMPAVSPTYDGPRETRVPVEDNRVVHFRSAIAGFLITDLARNAKPQVAEVTLPPVAYLSEERTELRAVNKWREETPPGTGGLPSTPVPEYKFLSSGYGQVDLNDRVWVHLRALGQKVPGRAAVRRNSDSATVTYAEPPEYAVFRLNGEFLGVVRMPINTREIAPIGNTIWTIMIHEDGAPELVKFRLDRLDAD